MHMSPKLRALGLVVVGFIGGVVGLSIYVRTPLADSLGRPLAVNNICDPGAQSEDDDVFFLSCGGIF